MTRLKEPILRRERHYLVVYNGYQIQQFRPLPLGPEKIRGPEISMDEDLLDVQFSGYGFDHVRIYYIFDHRLKLVDLLAHYVAGKSSEDGDHGGNGLGRHHAFEDFSERVEGELALLFFGKTGRRRLQGGYSSQGLKMQGLLSKCGDVAGLRCLIVATWPVSPIMLPDSPV